MKKSNNYEAQTHRTNSEKRAQKWVSIKNTFEMSCALSRNIWHLTPEARYYSCSAWDNAGFQGWRICHIRFLPYRTGVFGRYSVQIIFLIKYIKYIRKEEYPRPFTSVRWHIPCVAFYVALLSPLYLMRLTELNTTLCFFFKSIN